MGSGVELCVRMLGFAAASGSLATMLMLAAGGPMIEHLGWRCLFPLLLPVAFLLPFIFASMRPGFHTVPLSRKPIAAL